METAKYVAVQLKQKGSIKVVAKSPYLFRIFENITEYLDTESAFPGDKWINTGTIICRRIGL
jgi:hypothetical protein